MFRNRRRQEEQEEQQKAKDKNSPEDLLAKEAKMAEKLLEDLVPEEPNTKASKEEEKPVTESQEKPAAQEEAKEMGKPEGTEQPKPEEKPATGAPEGDQLSMLVNKVHNLGSDLVKLRDEIQKARDNYTTKAKEMEDVQAKLKDVMNQFS